MIGLIFLWILGEEHSTKRREIQANISVRVVLDSLELMLYFQLCMRLALPLPKMRWNGSVQFSSVAQLCPTLCDPMNRSMPGLPVHHQLPEFTENHVHWVGDAIQPSHPLLSPSPPAPNPPSIRVFSNESTLSMRWPKYWSFSFTIIPSKEHPGLISFRMDWLEWYQKHSLTFVLFL